MYSMYFVFSYFICPVYCSIDTNACQYVRIKKLYWLLFDQFQYIVIFIHTYWSIYYTPIEQYNAQNS